MTLNYINQNSSKISDLKKEKSILSSDYIFMDSVDSKGNVKTVKMMYQEFKKCMVNRLDGKFIFGSMVHERKEDYAKFAHGHNYSYFQFYNAYGKGAISSRVPTEDCYESGSITTFNGENSTKTKVIMNIMYIPIQDAGSDTESQQYVGDIQFLLIDDFQNYITSYRGWSLKDFGEKTNVDINSESFEGFVIPNGTTYTCMSDEFEDACRLFSENGNSNSTSFKVPDLSEFNPNHADSGKRTSVGLHTDIPALIYIGKRK